MSFFRKSASAFGKLITVIVLAGTFIVGLVGVVYMSLQGQALAVPEIVGKDLVESEKELAAMGLRIKKRADRYSTEKPNTVLEQLPKAGETVKTGQMILVVTSKTNPEGDEKPVTIKKNVDEIGDSEKIEELISDKPKKTNKTNTNSAKKKSSTTRDVIGNNSNDNSNSSSDGNSNAKTTDTGDKSSKNAATNINKATNSNKTNSNASKPESNKSATGGDVRPRRTPQP